MARKKDLGGLAALAGLAYMASRDKATKGEAPVSDTKPSSAPDLGEIRDEEGTVSKLRRNTETGELYDPTGSSASPAAPARKPAAPAARRAPAGGGGLENARDAILARQGRANSNTEEGMRGYVPRRSAAQQIAGMDDTYNPRVRRGMNAENADSSDMAYKKGGSVKGWGIARGARKAKTY